MELQVNQTQPGTRAYPMHRHNFYEVMYYTHGVGTMRTECGDLPFSEGTVVIVPPRMLHGSSAEGGFVNISIACDFGGLFCTARPISFADAKGDGLLLARLIYENRYGESGYTASLCQCYARYLLQESGNAGGARRSIRDLVNRISEEAFDSRINVAEILRESGFAEDYARACFKRETGKTPIEYLTAVRIDRACFLMDVYGDGLSLAQIAERCGYTDYVYFSRKFKELRGVSPRKYQKGDRI